MKVVYQNELVKVTRDIWENDIRKEINEWEEFSKSCFCDTEERKESAMCIIRCLHDMLETLLQENGLTEEQIEWFLYLT